MNKAWLTAISIDNKNLRYKFWIIVALVLPIPFSLFIYILYNNNLLFALSKVTNTIVVLLAFLLVMAVLILLHEIFSKFLTMANVIKEAAVGEATMPETTGGTLELREASRAFNQIMEHHQLAQLETEHNRRSLAALQDLANTARKSLDLEVLLTALMEKAVEITDARIASVFLAEMENQRFSILATHGFTPKEKENSYIPFEHSVARYVLRSREPMVVENINLDARFGKRNNNRYGTPSFACIPVMLDDELIAVVNLADKTSGKPFEKEDMHILTVMLNEIHFALENAQIHKSIKLHALNLESRTVELHQEISKRKQVENELKHLAHNDPLTGLSNRALFLDRLRQGLAQAKRWRKKVAVLFLDLDNFKPINDMLGHEQGDIVLREIAKRLRHSLRDVDIIARHGGDEFTIAMLDVNTADDASRVAQKVLDCLMPSFMLKGREHYVGGSIGISIYPEDGTDAEELVNHADTAMYLSKNEGKNSYKFYTQQLGEQVKTRLELELELRQAVKDEQFELYYQPQIDVGTGELSGLEALIRWNHPQRGLVPPGQFIPLAEKIGLIETIGEWVLRQACIQQNQWVEEGVMPVRMLINMAVNISARQFQGGGIVETVTEILDKTGLNPCLLELEITEGILMEHAEDSAVLLNKLKKMGLHLAIDDFGTGFSSLTYLKQFPIDTLKIDRSFVMSLPMDENDAAIVRAIINLAHNMGIKTIAEGVETVEQLKFLQELHCNEVQGYLFSRPVPAKELGQMLQNRKIMEQWQAYLGLQQATHLNHCAVEI
jgi:diguanylate cyclase (GGDEF)-like protein